ncbi:MAG: mevalonate kinase family protein [Halioglobus sp.]
MIETRAYARAGLIGNPSDGYFGKTISVILRNFSARVTCYESPLLNIAPCQRDKMNFGSVGDLVADVQLNGYYGGLRLIKASIKRFSDYCNEQGIALDDRNFTLEYATDIPIRVGLAGSSGIVTATMRALMQFYEVSIPPAELASLVLSVELDELAIGAGLQDRVIQAYEGVVFMDFDEAKMRSCGYGNYESLAPALLPPLFVAYHDRLSEGTEVTHNDLRSRFNRGDPEVLAGMREFAGLAQSARDLLVDGNGHQIGPLLDENFALRTSLITVSEGNRQLVGLASEQGASAKLAGSGGAVIGTYDGDPERLDALREAYAQIGAHLVDPVIKNKDEK